MKITVDGERKLAYFPQTEGASTMIEDYDKALDSALERDEDPEEYLRFKTEDRQREAEHVTAMNQQANARMAALTGIDEECEECGHAITLHADKYGCEFERGDEWVTGNQPSAPTVLMAQGPCGCTAVDRLQALLAKIAAHMAAAVLLLLLCVPARADSLDVISGTLTGIPGDTLTYNLTVQTTIRSDFGGFVLDTMGGTVVQVFSNGFVSTENFGGDLFAFGLDETIILAEFGIYSGNGDPYGPPPVLTTGYDFIGSPTGVSIRFIDPPAFSAATATPEPQVWYMILAGIALLILFFPRGRKEYRR